MGLTCPFGTKDGPGKWNESKPLTDFALTKHQKDALCLTLWLLGEKQTLRRSRRDFPWDPREPARRMPQTPPPLRFEGNHSKHFGGPSQFKALVQQNRAYKTEAIVQMSPVQVQKIGGVDSPFRCHRRLCKYV